MGLGKRCLELIGSQAPRQRFSAQLHTVSRATGISLCAAASETAEGELSSYLQRESVVMLQEPHEAQGVVLVLLPQLPPPFVAGCGPIIAAPSRVTPSVHVESRARTVRTRQGSNPPRQQPTKAAARAKRVRTCSRCSLWTRALCCSCLFCPPQPQTESSNRSCSSRFPPKCSAGRSPTCWRHNSGEP